MTAFEEFGVMPEIGKALDDMEWNLPTDIQSEAIGQILGGGDVLMAAETGSGKTGAFCVPLIQVVYEFLRDLDRPKGEKETSWKMSLSDRSGEMVVHQGGLRLQSSHFKNWNGCRSSLGVTGSGRYYYEASIPEEGICRVGFSLNSANLNLGTCRDGYGFGGTGMKSNNRQFDPYGTSYGKASVVGCMLDLNEGKISFSKDGEDLGVAFQIYKDHMSEAFFPSVSLKNASIELNFGEMPFKYAPKNGYIPFSQATEKNIVINKKSLGQKIVKINNAPLAVIIEPSRELAEQTYNQIGLFKKYLGKPTVRELLVVGGMDIKSQVSALSAGTDIVVGTPGRLEDLVQSNKLSLEQCRFFVLDEADGLLKAGYEKMIVRFHESIPKMTSDGSRLQMIVCSATLHSFEVKKLAEKVMHFPTWVDLKGQDSVPETVHHVIVKVDPEIDRSAFNSRHNTRTDGVHERDEIGPGIRTSESLSEAVKILKSDYCVRAIDEHKMDQGIIFCRTKLDCDNLERYFNFIGGGCQNKGNPYSCVCLHSDRKPQERTGNLQKFKNGDVKFLICTDVAARGLDIKGLPFMINLTLPDEKSNYVHRIGRVGRAERMGLAISLVSTVKEKVWYHGSWCGSRGRNCFNTNLTDTKGCCIWYNEMQCLADIEEHLGITIQQVSKEIKVKADEFDGKVVYGEKRKEQGTGYVGHATELAPTLAKLIGLETEAQSRFLHKFYGVGNM